MKQLADYINKHAGEVMYIIGCAETLNSLTTQQLDFLKDQTTIGINWSVEKIEHLTYAISGHMEMGAYILDHGHPETVVFVHKSEPVAYATELWDNERVVAMWDQDPRVPLDLESARRNQIYGNSSSLLSATHLAYIMGASVIVYIGFEEKSALHYFNLDDEIEERMLSNMKKTLESKKYWNPTYYSTSWQGIRTKQNIHASLEAQLNMISGAPAFASNFMHSVEKLKKMPYKSDELNFYHLKNYVEFLNKSGILTQTRATEGITIEAGCEKTYFI
jgi:hypothetical protein